MRIFIIILRAKLSGAVYCYRSWLCVCSGRAGDVCLCVCLWVCYHEITRNCVHRSLPNWVCNPSDHLQLIKFWPSRAPGKGSVVGRNFCLRLTTASAQCLRLYGRFFSTWIILKLLLKSSETVPDLLTQSWLMMT